MKKILLINPPRYLRNPDGQFFCPQIGLASIASYLRQYDYEVKIIDADVEGFANAEEVEEGLYRCGLSWDNLRERIEDYRPDVVGISCIFTPRFKNALKISQIVKVIDDKVKVIVGGVHVSFCPQEVLAHETIDFVVIGEGERPFLMLLEALRGDSAELSKIDGIGFRNSVGKVVINSKVNLVDDLDQLPLPAWDLLPIEKYFQTKRNSLTTERKHISIMTSRGCPQECTFCCSSEFWMRRWRKRSADNVLAEIEFLVKKYGVREISFEDDNLSLDPVRLEKICSMIIERGYDLRWNTPNGISVRKLTPTLIKLMKRSGCTRLNFGIESGDEHILHDIIKKNISLQKVREVISWCKREGVTTLGYFVIGMPGETPESIKNSIEFAKSSELDEIMVHIATPFPGTELYKTCKDKGYLKYDYDTIVAEDEIENKIIFETPFISTEDLCKYRSRFYSEFYKTKAFKNPFYYLKRSIKNPILVWRYVKELFNG